MTQSARIGFCAVVVAVCLSTALAGAQVRGLPPVSPAEDMPWEAYAREESPGAVRQTGGIEEFPRGPEELPGGVKARNGGAEESPGGIEQLPGGPGALSYQDVPPQYQVPDWEPRYVDPRRLGSQWAGREQTQPEAIDISSAEPTLAPGARPGVFQKAVFQSTWLAEGRKAEDFGMVDLELWGDFGFACPSRTSPLVVTPGFGVHFFEGALGIDLPGEVYDAYTQFRWMGQIGPRLGVDLGVTPGWYSDLQHGSRDALRISGYGAASYALGPASRLVLGLSYLDREDVKFLPIGGLVWKPNDQTAFDLVVPRPRIARRLPACGLPGEGVEDWVYLAGEFGGGAWAVRRSTAFDDVIAYRDYRVILGVERKVLGGLSAQIEMGYVFGRKLEFQSGGPDVEPADTVMIRAGARY